MKINDVFKPSGFFSLRTPLLPMETALEFMADLELPPLLEREGNTNPERLTAAYEADLETLTKRLEPLLERADIREALLLASPSLERDIARYRNKPFSKQGRRIMQSLVKYLFRMVTRCTPFGLFAGTSLGKLGTTQRLRLGPSSGYTRQTRLDMGFLSELTARLNKDANLRDQLSFRPNTSLYRMGDQLRYAEARHNQRELNYFLVGAETDEFLLATLERAATGSRRQQLADALCDDEITMEDALDYIDNLIDAQILVSDLAPMLTGADATQTLEQELKQWPEVTQVQAVIEQVSSQLERVDEQGLGVEPDTYRALGNLVQTLDQDSDIARLFQVDMAKPGHDLQLGENQVKHVLGAVDVLHRLFGAEQDDQLSNFKDRFEERYGDREVPLTEVLDEDSGIGAVRKSDLETGLSPLMQAIPFPAKANYGNRSQVSQLITSKLWEMEQNGGEELVIHDEDLVNLARPKPLPDAFACMFSLLANNRILFNTMSGPSGARILGRFCGADPELHDRVRDHLRAEERQQEQAIFAEIVHHPEGRTGNVLARPLLREYELVYLGRSGAPREKQIHVQDLLVSVQYGRVILRHQKLGVEVIPRLTTAHNTSHRALGVYRFLGMLQFQGVCNGLQWQWPGLEHLPHLPRVRYGNIILSAARWRVDGNEIKKLLKQKGQTAFLAVNQWRLQRGIPKRVALMEGDHLLTVFFDNPLSVEALLHRLKKLEQAFLSEELETDGQVSGPEGHFHHEIVLPFEKKTDPPKRVPIKEMVETNKVIRRFLPGSECMFLKVFCGPAGADQFLVQYLTPLLREMAEQSLIHKWFFMRFEEPSFHLRIRLFGPSQGLWAYLDRISATVDEAISKKLVWKLELDTYERELNRYGGPAGMELCEAAFHTDSEATLGILNMLAGEEAWEMRWRLALLGKHLLLDDVGYSLEKRHKLMQLSSQGFLFEYNMEEQGPWPIRTQFREHRALVEQTLVPSEAEHPLLATARAIFAHRGEQLAQVFARLNELETAGKLVGHFDDLVWSLLHMHANRIIRNAPRPHELVLHTYLERYYYSEMARQHKS